MPKLIALRDSLTDIAFSLGTQINFFSQVKQLALFFDHIGYLELDTRVDFLKLGLSRKGIEFPEGEYEWLKENEIIFDPLAHPINDLKEQPSTPYSSKKFESEDSQKYEQLFFILKEKTREFDNLVRNSEDLKSEENLGNLARVVYDQNSTMLRLIAIKMESAMGISAVTMLPYINYTPITPNSIKNDCIQIVVNKLPIPDELTPWEQIVDYRNDSTNQKNLLAFRRWIRKISNENLSRVEIEEEIEYLINEFEEHMKLHKIKANTEMLETIVKAPLEIIENLVNLRFSKIPEPLFALKKRELSLLEAEINAPGRELSYFIKTRDAFQS